MNTLSLALAPGVWLMLNIDDEGHVIAAWHYDITTTLGEAA